MRKFTALIGSLALGVALSGCWPQYGNGPGRTFFNPDETTITAANVHELAPVWETPGSVLSPISVEGSIYTVVGRTVKAVDAASGEERWTAGPFTVETPVGSIQVTPKRLLYAKGAILLPYSWYGTTTIRGGGFFVLSRADGSTLRTIEAATEDVIVKDGELATMDVQTLGGQGPRITTIHWTYQPVYLQDTWEPGLQWAFVGDRIVATTGGEVMGFDDRCPAAPAPLQGCWPNWLTDLNTTLTAPAAVGTDQVAFGGNDGILRVRDAASGTEVWTGNAGLAITASPAVTDDTIVVGTYDGRVVAFPAAGCGAATCAPLWEGSVGSAVLGRVVVAGDVVYVVDNAREVVAFPVAGCGAATCAPLTTIAADANPNAGVIVDGGRLVAATGTGLVAYGLPG